MCAFFEGAAGGWARCEDSQQYNAHTNVSLTQMTFGRPSTPKKDIAALVTRSSYTFLFSLSCPRCDGDERREPEDGEENVNGSMRVRVGEAFHTVELGDGSLVYEEGDAEPALVG